MALMLVVQSTKYRTLIAPSFMTNPVTPTQSTIPRSIFCRKREVAPSGGDKQYSRIRSLMAAVSLSAIASVSAATALGLTLSAAFGLSATPALAQTYPTLSSGSSGDTVSQLQATLKLLGFYSGEVSGTYDDATVSAVAQFQTAAGISADGVAGPSTWQKLLPSPDEVTAISSAAPISTPAPAPAAQALPAPESPAQPKQPLGPPVLRLEAEGPAVAQLQRELQTLGYYTGDIDGGFGEQTKAAVEAFQTDQQMFVDGVVGKATWDALSRALDSL